MWMSFHLITLIRQGVVILPATQPSNIAPSSLLVLFSISLAQQVAADLAALDEEEMAEMEEAEARKAAAREKEFVEALVSGVSLPAQCAVKSETDTRWVTRRWQRLGRLRPRRQQPRRRSLLRPL